MPESLAERYHRRTVCDFRDRHCAFREAHVLHYRKKAAERGEYRGKDTAGDASRAFFYPASAGERDYTEVKDPEHHGGKCAEHLGKVQSHIKSRFLKKRDYGILRFAKHEDAQRDIYRHRDEIPENLSYRSCTAQTEKHGERRRNRKKHRACQCIK